MKKIRAAVIGYGNVGRFVVQALRAAEDFEIAGIVRRCGVCAPQEISDLKVVGSIGELKDVDVAILCTPSRLCREYALKCLESGVNTVDSFDIHTEICAQRAALDQAAKKAGKACIISAGWDPGTDSIVRAMFSAMAPKGITYTNFGPGMSMGHSVAVKALPGVRDALSLTIPEGTGIHRRMVYVELEDGACFDCVEAAVKNDPYFVHDETHVFQVKSVDELKDMGHGVNMVRKGVSGSTHNQNLEFNMSINNPALTGQILVCAARAVTRRTPGAYTLIEVPVIDLLAGDRDELIKSLV